MLRYLVVEDEWEVSSLLKEVVESLGSKAVVATTQEDALSLAETYRIDIALIDIKLPDGDGVELLARLRTLCPETVFIMVTSVYETDVVVRAVKEGASEYITKPFNVAYLKRLLQNYQDLVVLRKRTEAEEKGPDEIIGESEPMRRLKKTIQEVAPYDTTVLITGPTGTGKELIARVIHRLSRRRNGPFVVLDCTSIPSSLMESELFGCVRGAYTGATEDRQGLVERADGGTLFIDEIGDLDLSLQPKLLRFLDTGVFRRVGSSRERRVDVRVLAATNRDLKDMLREGRFREDLYYRLNVVHLKVPPLRDREEDLMLLANHFLQRFARELKKPLRGFSKEAEEVLRTYQWPGNVRELKNTVERAVVLAKGEWVVPADMAILPEPQHPLESDEILPLREMEKRYIRHVLKLTGNNKSKAASLLGITRKTLREKLNE